MPGLPEMIFPRRQVLQKPDWLFLNRLDKMALGQFFSQPVAEENVFLDFPALVPVLSLFSGLMLRFAEWIFRIANCLTDDVQCLHHTVSFLANFAA